MSILNDWRRLRLESIMHYHHHMMAFELRVVKITVEGPYFSQQDGVFLDQFRSFTASQPFQSTIISIMNGCGQLRLGGGM